MVRIQDNTVRDGMQQRNINKNFRTKLQAFELIGESGIDSVEIGMCASDEDYVMLCEEAKRLKDTQEAVVLTRLVKTDIDLALRLFKKFPNLVIKLLVPISDLHIEKKLGFTRGVMKYKLEECLKYLQQSSIKTDVCFEDATRADMCYLIDILDMCSHYEINFITIADTVGCMVPEEFGNLINKIKNRGYPFKISVHCHNDMGLATANSIAGIINGAEQVETTFLGIGERAGNTSVEEVTYILQKKYNLANHIKLDQIYRISNQISACIHFNPDSISPIIGENVFVHESGIHQDGMLKDVQMYQFVSPQEFGIPPMPLGSSLSGISSSKLIFGQVTKEFGKIEDVKEVISFYRTAAKVIDGITVEEACDLYKVLKLAS